MLVIVRAFATLCRPHDATKVAIPKLGSSTGNERANDFVSNRQQSRRLNVGHSSAEHFVLGPRGVSTRLIFAGRNGSR